MGLAGPRKRAKISHDPNNTAWTRSTTTFGHKILTSQGWKPGDLLGPQDAAHASYHTNANASHIRVVLKDDTLGLGAKNGNQRPEDFGLDVYASVLGRLNGKDDQVMKKEEQYREDVRRRLYADGKFGGMRFVSGGILERDVLFKPMYEGMDVDEKVKVEEEPSVKKEEGDESVIEMEVDDETPAEELSEKEQRRLRKKEKKRQRELAASAATIKAEEDVSAESSEASQSLSKESRKKDHKKTVSFDNNTLPEVEISSKEKRRQAKKEEKQRRKEEKKRLKQDNGIKEEEEDEDQDVDINSVPTKEVQAVKVTAAPLAKGRQLLRQRNIMQKRMATMNATAMNEIFMIKS